MANFLEFLKSGKTAEEFINTSVLPQHVLPVEKTDASPAPYKDDDDKEKKEEVKKEETEKKEENCSDDIFDEAVDRMTDEDWKNLDEKYDAAFMEALELAEEEGFDDSSEEGDEI